MKPFGFQFKLCVLSDVMLNLPPLHICAMGMQNSDKFRQSALTYENLGIHCPGCHGENGRSVNTGVRGPNFNFSKSVGSIYRVEMHAIETCSTNISGTDLLPQTSSKSPDREKQGNPDE